MLKSKNVKGCYSTIFKTSSIHRKCIFFGTAFHSVDRCRRSAQPRKRHGKSDRRPELMKCRCGLWQSWKPWTDNRGVGHAWYDMSMVNDSDSPRTDFEYLTRLCRRPLRCWIRILLTSSLVTLPCLVSSHLPRGEIFMVYSYGQCQVKP